MVTLVAFALQFNNPRHTLPIDVPSRLVKVLSSVEIICRPTVGEFVNHDVTIWLSGLKPAPRQHERSKAISTILSLRGVSER